MYGRIPVFMRLQRFAGANATGKGGLSLVILHFQKLAFKNAPGGRMVTLRRGLHSIT